MQTLFGAIAFLLSFQLLAHDNPYQLGSSWSKREIKQSNLNSLPQKLITPSKSVAKFLGGTSFYIGKFDGRHIMATNYHVLPSPLNCFSLNRVSFPIFRKSFSCKKFVVGIPEVDLSLFEIKVPRTEEAILNQLTFSIAPDHTDSLLYGFGFGGYENPNRQLLLSHDSNCKFFSSETRELTDPDTINPVSYKVWSKAIGCDFSHGDSGAPIFNNRGQFMGIFWTGAVPKAQYLKSDSYLEQMIKDNSESIWSELSYMSPITNIIRSFKVLIKNEHHSKQLLESILKTTKPQ